MDKTVGPENHYKSHMFGNVCRRGMNRYCGYVRMCVCSMREASWCLLFPMMLNKRDKWTPHFFNDKYLNGEATAPITLPTASSEQPRKSHDALKVRSLKTLLSTWLLWDSKCPNIITKYMNKYKHISSVKQCCNEFKN